jgi:1-acyl-sn-glycerol-3-phosphate acyltransferase
LTLDLSLMQKGAFSVAVKQNVPIVPIALVGTGKLMASGKEGSLHSGEVKIIVHPPMSGTDADKLMNETQDVIHKTLVEYGAE